MLIKLRMKMKKIIGKILFGLGLSFKNTFIPPERNCA